MRLFPRQAIEALNEELLDPSSPSIADVRLMDGRENFYQRLLNDAGVKKELGGGNIPEIVGRIKDRSIKSFFERLMF